VSARRHRITNLNFIMPNRPFKSPFTADAIIVVLALGLLIASTAHASNAGDATAPRPGGVYPLAAGMYVAQGSDCASAANAALREYDGKGIGSAHTHACKVTLRAHTGNTYIVDQSCIDAGAGPAPRSSERQTVRIVDAHTFVQTIGKDATTYHYCPAP
jgi:hypothetical protein